MNPKFYALVFAVLFCISSCDRDKTEYYNIYNTFFPRNVNIVNVATGSCLDDIDGSLILKSKENLEFTWKELCLSIQTSNYAQTEWGNSFVNHYKFFSFPELASDIDKHKSSPLVDYEKMLLECKTTAKPSSYISPGFQMEYRTDWLNSITITADTTLYGKHPGTDLSAHFNIVSFYANTVGKPSLIVSKNNDAEKYLAIKNKISIIDDKTVSILHCNDSTIVSPYTNKIFDTIPLDQWVRTKPIIDPALYIQFAEKPGDDIVTVSFKVIVETTSGKTLEASTEKITISSK